MYGRNDWIMRLNFRCFLRLSRLTDLRRDARILDCGCAMGHLILRLRAFGFTNVAGLDSAPEMVEAARSLTGATILHCDALDLARNAEAGSFDAVVVSDLLHHFAEAENWEKLLAGCRTVLKEGGLLVIREPWPTFLLKLLYRMSRHRVFYVGFLKARLQSFIEEDALVQHFFTHWIGTYKERLARHGFRIERDLSWLVHRITACRKEGDRR